MLDRAGTLEREPHRQRRSCWRWGALAFGAVYDWAFWPLAAACALCGSARADAAQSRAAPAGPLLTVVCLAAVAAATLVQLVPLPVDAARRRCLREPARVLSELDIAVRGAGRGSPRAVDRAGGDDDGAGAVRGVRVADAWRGQDRVAPPALAGLAALIAGLGVVLALVGIVQRPLYAGKIYGFWAPIMAGSPFGPFVNKNHFAGWMLMALPLTFGLLCASAARGHAAASDRLAAARALAVVA